jgi:hypothetical protein
MHGHRTGAPAPGSRAFSAQRAVLLELVIDPPPAGDPADELPGRLGHDADAIAAAIDELVTLGLADRRAGSVHATPAALRFEELWLVRA